MFKYKLFSDEDVKEYDLNMFFSKQSILFDTSTLRDEFEAMNLLFNKIPNERKEILRKITINMLRGRKKTVEEKLATDVNKRIKQTQDLRQKGNDLFNAKVGDIKHNSLAASHLYTEAIFAALDTNNDELAFGFANRAMALQSFGYYQQAYDDCVCALNLNYPALKRHKIILRQAYCSIKLKDLPKAEEHLAELQLLSLNKANENERQNLIKAFEELKQEINESKVNFTEHEEKEQKIKTEESFIDGKGRCMRTICAIKENELIFSDRASAFIPKAGVSQLCNQCGITHFIPIPCLHCCGRVVYCSLKCQNDHIILHKYECPAFRLNLFPEHHDVLLVLRILFDRGIFSILEDLKLGNETSISQIWCELREGGKIWINKNIPYSKLLQMITHFSKSPLIEQKCFILLSHYSMMYLKEFTNCFEILNAKNKLINWELLIASLILLHLCQKVANAQGLSVLTTIPCELTMKYPFHMLNAKLWISPWHLKLGRLNLFCNFEDLGSLFLPNYSLCNHSCVRLFEIKFCGRFLRTYALHDIEKGQEITTCYTPDYRQGKRKSRLNKLQQHFHFKCQCENCCQSNIEDVEFNKFNQYRCDNSNCNQIFVPNENQVNWFKKKEQLNCTICGRKQNMKEFFEIFDLVPLTFQPLIRRSLYKNFKKLEHHLLGLNEARCKCAHGMIFGWFTLMLEKGVTLNDQDYVDIIDMLKFVLKVTKARHHKQSHEYMSYLTYLLDLMAFRKYIPSKVEMNEILMLMDIILDDNSKRIFLNYYNDYIKEYINK